MLEARGACFLGAGFLLLSAGARGQSPLVPVFTDVTSPAGVTAVHGPGPNFASGIQDITSMGGGVAVGDFDNDGWQDIYFVSGGAQPDSLFMNEGDGTFIDRAADAGVGRPHMGTGAAAGDFDGDGWLDIFVTSLGFSDEFPTVGRHILWHNNGDLTFTDVAVSAGVNLASPTVPDGLGAAFGDYDLDGDLDLYVASWIFFSDGNRLFRNEGDGTFTDVTVSAGVHELGIRGFAPRFADMDGDRWPELLVSADFGTSRYYVNNRDGTFTEATQASGTGLDGNGMGQCVGDFDGNGLLDWYVTSIHSLNSGAADIPGTGNMLYLNDGEHSYTEVSVPAGVNDGGWGWGTVAVDVNNDGLLDIAETNGFKQYNGDGIQEWRDERCYLWLNDGTGTFVESGVPAGFVDNGPGRGLATLDFDRDGDQDLVLVVNKGRFKLYRNDLPAGATRYLRVVLDSSASPYLAPNGIGARVSVRSGGAVLVRTIDSGSAYLATSELVAHFGLRALEHHVDLRVEWPGGRDTYVTQVEGNQELVVRFCPGDWNGYNGVTSDDFIDFRHDWLAGDADFNGDGATDVQDFLEFEAAYEAGCP